MIFQNFGFNQNYPITISSVIPASLIFDLDAANYSAMPNVATSANFNGTNQQLSVPANNGFDFGTGDFTIECWIYPTTLKLANVYLQLPGGSTYIFFGLANASGAMRFNANNGASYDPYGTTQTADGLITINTWYHVAYMRKGDTHSLFINGVCRGTQSGVAAYSMGGNADEVYIGLGDNFAGNISNFRVVKGSNVYTYGTTVGTTYFTTPTKQLTAVTGTQLLLPLYATAFKDISTNKLSVTNTNTVIATGLAPSLTQTDASGIYTITSNSGSSLTWDSANSGTFAKSNNIGSDFIVGGPNYVTGQSYTVFMAYKLSAASSGRLLNTQTEASKDWLMGAYNGNPNAFYPNFSVNLPGSGADTVWHLDWATWDTTTNTGRLYTSTNTAPTTHSFTGTNAGGGGFNQFRLFSRSGGSEVQSGNIGFVKVYDGVLDISTIQALHATYKARFGY
jgi:hypothetical protein